MTLTITSLRTDYRVTPQGNVWIEDVPFIIVNCTFRITDDDSLWQRAKAESEEYSSVLTIDDPKRYEEFLLNWDFNFDKNYDGYGRTWTHNESPWQYIEKFDTFHFREWIADSAVTNAMIREIDHYRFFGRLKSVYRHTEDCIILQHLRALQGYWD